MSPRRVGRISGGDPQRTSSISDEPVSNRAPSASGYSTGAEMAGYRRLTRTTQSTRPVSLRELINAYGRLASGFEAMVVKFADPGLQDVWRCASTHASAVRDALEKGSIDSKFFPRLVGIAVLFCDEDLYREGLFGLKIFYKAHLEGHGEKRRSPGRRNRTRTHRTAFHRSQALNARRSLAFRSGLSARMATRFRAM